MTDWARQRAPGRILLAWVVLTSALVLVLLPPRTARAIEYEVFIDVDDEEELYDLYVTQQISESTFNDLLDLIRRGVDLDVASREELYALPNLTYDDVDRIIAYRTQAGRITDPAALVVAGVLPRRTLESIAAFLVVPDPGGEITTVRGFARYRTVWTVEDHRVPPMALQARVSTFRNLTVGAAGLLDRNRLAPVTWDPNRGALVSEGRKTQPRLVKFFAQWDTPRWGIIAGTYSIGFGQRLVFDTSGRYTPNGFYLDDTVVRQQDLTVDCKLSTGELTETPCPRDEPRRYVTPDYTIREGLRGAAAGFKDAKLPVGWLQGYGFFSYQTRSIYQYAIYDRSRCEDPRLDPDLFPECSAPDLLRRQDDLLAPAPALSFTTLPNAYNEILGGGNFSWFRDRRTHVGVTGYGATTRWLVEGADLDFQETARYPFSPRKSAPRGSSWGAVGADMAYGRDWADLFVELAFSFDEMGNGPEGLPLDTSDSPPLGAIVRHTATWRTHEIEASIRYYDTNFVNPYARSIAASDVSDGLRASDEMGGRLRYTGLIADRLSLRAFADFWGEPPLPDRPSHLRDPAPKARLYARSDVRVLPWLMPGLWLEWQTRDLTARGRANRCYDQGQETYDDVFEFEEAADQAVGTGAPSFYEIDAIRCSGQRYRITGRLRFDPHKRVYFSLQYRHDFADDGHYDERMRQDANAFFQLGANPVDPLRMRFRLRYANEDIHDPARLEESLWAYMDLAYTVRRWFIPSVRYDFRMFLDDRESTAFRRPNPEHWLHFQLESRF